jgi:hypothetical protein
VEIADSRWTPLFACELFVDRIRDDNRRLVAILGLHGPSDNLKR